MLRGFLLRGLRACSAGGLADQSSKLIPGVQGTTDQSQVGRLACLALLGAAAVGTAQSEAFAPAAPDKELGWSFLSLDQRRRYFFKYENRIRDMSPQEKVFDYFASQQDETGASYMLAGDMLRSVVPVYPPAGSNYVRSGSLAGEPNPETPVEESAFFKIFDLNGDGRICFEEYILFVTLLAIPSEDIEVAFKILDTDLSGKVDAREFGKLLDALQRRAGARSTASTRHVGHTDSPERAGLLVRFFGTDGQGQLTLEGFTAFLAALREELVRLEFQYYDYDNKGYITGSDFAHSIVGCAGTRFIDEYLDKVQQMPPALAGAKVSLAELVAFREVLRRLRCLSVALEFMQNANGRVSEEDVVWVAQHVLHTQLSNTAVDTLFYLFGSKERGLNVQHMYKVLSRHPGNCLHIVYEYQVEPRKNILECIKECTRSASPDR